MYTHIHAKQNRIYKTYGEVTSAHMKIKTGSHQHTQRFYLEPHKHILKNTKQNKQWTESSNKKKEGRKLFIG